MKTTLIRAARNCLHTFGVLLIAATLNGCATNPVRQTYSDRTADLPESVRQRISSTKTEAANVLWLPESDYSRERTARAKQDYALLGESNFRGLYPSEGQLQRHAKKVGADLVLYTSRNASIEERARPAGADDFPNLVTSKRFGSPVFRTDANRGMHNYPPDLGVTGEPRCDFEVSFWRSLRQQ